MTLIEDLYDLQIPDNVKLSPDGQSVVYSTTLSFGHKTGEHTVSTIWLAQTGQAKSARQLTSGLHNDHAPQWSPDGESITFISDRAKPGESFAIYVLPLGGGEALAVTPAENEKSIDRFEFAPDGKTIAYLSADEKTEERKAKDKAKDDAQVWGEDWPYNRLRLVDLSTKAVTTLVGEASHITDLAWNDSGAKLAFFTVRTPWIESPMLYGTDISTVDVQSKSITKLTHFPQKIKDLVWAGESVYFLGPAAETIGTSSEMVFHIDLKGAEVTYKKNSHGVDNCATSLHKAGGDVLVGVQDGMEDQIRILGGHTLFGKKRKIDAWAAAFTKDSDEVVMAVAQGDTNHPCEVFSTTASGGALVQLSDLGHTFTSKYHTFGTCTFLSCPSSDGKVQLECPWLTPSSTSTNSDGLPEKPLPTVVLIHGGPYSRHTEAFDGLYFYWSNILLSAGYGILLADYRGSSGRGEDWAAYARGVGKYDYEDIIAQTQHAIEKGYADKERLVVGGWSQGGFLSFLCSVRNGTHGHGWAFKASIPGAGVSDQDTMAFTSDIGCWQAEVAAGKPWQQSKSDVRNRQGSSIWEFGDAVKNKVDIPPMLILHGEKDERVPLEQSVCMRRAMEDAGLPYEYVVYPREGHIIKERKHLVGMDERVLRFVDLHIGGK
ncbi:hypothetical protein LTR36_005828 [Oleoguttula mirabilis]|uniref:Dipeptidyl-peptidase V n=1 Tax=Oleoguttula mirabilis TaxID=1507867 RepID=A0AAV9JCS7_9PEZI|nr:hypothetical protein LTR36_005828 [Oleoguttula mirabilis]